MNRMTNDFGVELSVARPAPMKRYLAWMLIGGALFLALMAASVPVLRGTGAMPPPQFSNSLCLDEKLNAMREAPPRAPELLVVGSSVAWRHFNSPAAVAARPALIPYNAGMCGLSITQTALVTSWLTERLPSVERVLLIASPFDFAGCANGTASRFDIDAADGFIFGRQLPALYYARHFDPVTLARNASRIRERRGDMSSFESLVQNGYGDGPIEPPTTRGLYYGNVEALDPLCFAHLRRMAQELGDQGKSFDLVLTPLHPDWVRGHAVSKGTLAGIRNGVDRALAGTGGRSYWIDGGVQPADFYDAIHIRWSTTPTFTRAILDQVYPAGSSGENGGRTRART